MARIVIRKATGPRKLMKDDLDDAKGNIAVCQCGLSRDFPFCDGSHQHTEDEDPDVLYTYETGDEVTRSVVTDSTCNLD